MLGFALLVVFGCLVSRGSGHACMQRLSTHDVGFSSVRFSDGAYGVTVSNWVASADTGDMRASEDAGGLELGYGSGVVSSWVSLGHIDFLGQKYGSANDASPATAFYSLRTNPINCSPFSSSSSSCVVEGAVYTGQVQTGWATLPSSYLALLSSSASASVKVLRPAIGEVFLLRLATSSSESYLVKLLVTEISMGPSPVNATPGATVLQAMSFRWANLYQSAANDGWCGISAASPTYVAYVVQSNLYGPPPDSSTSDFVAGVLIIYLIVFGIILAAFVAFAFWMRTLSKTQSAMLRQMGGVVVVPNNNNNNINNPLPPPGGVPLNNLPNNNPPPPGRAPLVGNQNQPDDFL